MAPMGADDASSIMLQAYLGGGGSAFGSGPIAPAPRGLAVCSPRMEKIAVSRSQGGNSSAIDGLLSGRWTPPAAPPKCMSEPSSSSLLSQNLRRPPMPRRAQRRGRSRPRDDAARASRDVDCSASQCETESELSEAYRDQPDNNCGDGSVLSHATTPSWRSRSFPANYRAPRAAPEGNKDGAEPQQAPPRYRLPPLPSEARGPRAPSSEARYLRKIASEVNEANAMLAESFLGAVRRPETDASYAGSFAHCGPGRSHAGLSVIPEMQSHCGSYEPSPHYNVAPKEEDAQSRVYSYRTKSEVGANGEKIINHYHVLHHYHVPSSSLRNKS